MTSSEVEASAFLRIKILVNWKMTSPGDFHNNKIHTMRVWGGEKGSFCSQTQQDPLNIWLLIYILPLGPHSTSELWSHRMLLKHGKTELSVVDLHSSPAAMPLILDHSQLLIIKHCPGDRCSDHRKVEFSRCGVWLRWPWSRSRPCKGQSKIQI